MTTTGAKILVVEDDPNIAEDLKYKLTSLDYRVTGPTSQGLGAVHLAQRCRPDLALMDISLRGQMDGVQAAEEMRRLQVPVVFVTGYSEGSVFERARNTEPSGYVLKPYDTSVLRVSIELALYKHKAGQERQRLFLQLQEARARFGSLSSRLSICAYCKKIKDEDAWIQIETYISQRTNASFSHGICPDCFQRVKQQLAAVEGGIMPPGTVLLG